jgi:hypothetical protein
MANKIQIEHGKLLMMSGPFFGDKIFIEEYVKPRDNYWGPFPDNGTGQEKLIEDEKRNGSPFDYNDFFKIVNSADIGIKLEIVNFGTNVVSVIYSAYNQKDFINDLKANADEKRLIITKVSLLEAKKVWDAKGLNSTIIKFGIGKSNRHEPVIFIHPNNDKTGTFNESDWPIRIPRDE